ncbi:MAG: hypothetical protein JWO10_1855 [Microbacteriaceae bacterium]|nr:hypothetical protein [Microbacteriaceae bacterium]
MNAAEEIDAMIAKHPDWRGAKLAEFRDIIVGIDPDIEETWKWMGAPVWERDGILVVGNIFKTKVKLGFMYGALIADPNNLFNGELGGNQRRSVEFGEGDDVDHEAFKTLVRAAISYNQLRRRK